MTQRADEVLAEDVTDEAGAQAAAILDEPQGRGRRIWVVPLIVGSALFMQNLNANSITTALPSMARGFGVDPVHLNVAIIAYLLGTGLVLPVSGWIADRFGARRVFMASMGLFAAASVLCGLSDSLGVLLICRVVQGGVGALLAPVGRMVLLRSTPKTELVSAMAVLTIPALLGPLLGPVLGGAIVTFLTWQWIFYLNVPIAIAGLLLVRAYVPDVREQAAPPLDWVGIVLTGLTLAAFVCGLGTLGRDELPAIAVGGLLASGLLGVVLYVLHARRAAQPVIDLKMFAIPTFRASVLGFLFQGLLPTATPFLLAMLLQVGFGMSALQAGFIAFTTAIGSLAMRTTAARILRRFGFRNTLMVTCLLSSGLTAACSLFRPDTPTWIMVFVLVAGGFARSLQFTGISGMTYADIDHDQMSRATTTSAMFQQFGQSVGVSLAALLLLASSAWRGEAHLTWQAVAPTFTVIAILALTSQIFFVALPKDAGDEMNNRSTKPKAA
ncbi:MFS transporter [Phenylobacterium immobile]|uniref:MFS transporter n=1 Tax=Phenylobacterium immobile TaxID=21 RepID=UPI000A5F6243|nr:MFS transporter [Phenylobacterium immobile]